LPKLGFGETEQTLTSGAKQERRRFVRDTLPVENPGRRPKESVVERAASTRTERTADPSSAASPVDGLGDRLARGTVAGS